VRDEAHRFAITYHRTLRRKEKFETPLQDIKGVGPTREKKLLKCFGRVKDIRKATVKEIQEAGLDKKTAERIKKRLK